MPGKSLLIMGYGELGGRVVDEIARDRLDVRIFVGGRDQDALRRRVNLARYMAVNLGHCVEIVPVRMDLLDVLATAETLGELAPDLVFNATTMAPWWMIDRLPEPLRGQVKRAGSGIWAAVDVLLPLRLSQALAKSGLQCIYVNATFPDLVNPVIYQSGIGPLCGIGNVANVTPGLRLAAAALLGAPVGDVSIRFVAHHFLSQSIPVTGTSAGAPYLLQVLLHGEDVSDRIEGEVLFRTVATDFPRVKGLAGIGVTVSSALRVLRPLLCDGTARANGSGNLHAPGVLGRPGGYPVAIKRGGVVFDLPPSVDLDRAVDVNNGGGRWDGIESVSASGITVTEEATHLVGEALAYAPGVITRENCEEKAFELTEKFRRLLAGAPGR